MVKKWSVRMSALFFKYQEKLKFKEFPSYKISSKRESREISSINKLLSLEIILYEREISK